MNCVRCSHPLPSGADRCLRCFALNPRGREAGKPGAPPPSLERPAFFEPPISEPELAAIGLSDPPAPLRVSIESDPPPPPLALSIESDPPAHSRASIASEPPPAQSSEPFELAPPVTSPSLPRLSRRSSPPGSAEDAAGGDLGDVDLDALEPPEESPGTTLHFGMPALPVHLTASDPSLRRTDPPEPPPAAAAPDRADLGDSWRITSHPPPPLAELSQTSAAPADLLSQSFDFGPPGAEPPHHLRAVPLEVELPGEELAPKRARPPWAPFGARLLAWSIDALLLALGTALQLVVAAGVVGVARLAPAGFGSSDYWLDLLAFGPRLPLLWGGLFACFALGYSWLFAARAGRTPGMALAGLRLARIGGGQVRALPALARAALSVCSAALGLFGFALALFDARGQTLHDKLTGTAVVRQDATLAPGARAL